MDFVIGTALRLIIIGIAFVAEIIVIILAFKKRSKSKALIAILLPPILFYCMFLQGTHRKAPIDEQDVILLAKEIAEVGIDNFKFGAYSDENDEFSVDIYYYKSESNEFPLHESELEKHFSVNGSSEGYDYYISPIHSYRPLGGFEMHQGYHGHIFVRIDSGITVSINYDVFRSVDEWLGFLFAAPVFKNYSLCDTVKNGKIIYYNS